MRKSKRIDFGIAVYDKKDKSILGFITNLSSVGCFIKTKKTIPLHTIINIEFELPDSLKIITVKSTVVRQKEDGIGSKFYLDDNQRKLVKQFIADFGK